MKKESCQKGASLLTEVLKTIKKYNLIKNGDRIVLGVSGGPDSIAMLNILNDIRNDKKLQMKFDIIVAHVNHMIREEAIDDQKFVENFCKKINVTFYAKSIDVQKIANNKKIGTEEAGRNARYEFFDEILEKENANKYIVSLIALLHDADDYKLFGMENAEKLTNAKIIMDDCNVDKAILEQVCDVINNIGYSKRLKGHSPTTLEGKIVSDVDMCDALEQMVF